MTFLINTRVNTLDMSSRREVFCLGCGEDIAERSSDRRSLTSTDAGRRVQQMWKHLLEIKLEERNGNIGISCEDLTEDGLMCRSCFSAFNRLFQLQTGIDRNLNLLVDKLSSVTIIHSRQKVRRVVSVTIYIVYTLL